VVRAINFDTEGKGFDSRPRGRRKRQKRIDKFQEKIKVKKVKIFKLN